MLNSPKIFLVFAFLFLGLNYNIAFGQNAQPQIAPFEKNKNFPSFEILLLDSISVLNTKSIDAGKPTVLILFSPDCDHCSKIAKEIKNNVSHFDSVNLFMIAPPGPLFDIKMFAHLNGLLNKKQITVGQDIDFIFGSFFHASTVPFVVVYDKNKKLFATFRALKTLEELNIELKKLK